MIHDHTSNFSQQAIALPKYKQKAIALHPTYIKQRSHFILPTSKRRSLFHPTYTKQRSHFIHLHQIAIALSSYLHQIAIALHPTYIKYHNHDKNK
ncbi:MAG: hypothetical protein ACKPA8_06475 [Dolichospermum sp.]